MGVGKTPLEVPYYRAVRGASRGAVRLAVSRGGFYGFIINPRVQLAVFIRRATDVLI